MSSRIDILKYVIYGVASAFLVYGVLLMVEGFFTSGAIRDLYGDFKITACGRCVSAWVHTPHAHTHAVMTRLGREKGSNTNQMVFGKLRLFICTEFNQGFPAIRNGQVGAV